MTGEQAILLILFVIVGFFVVVYIINSVRDWSHEIKELKEKVKHIEELTVEKEKKE